MKSSKILIFFSLLLATLSLASCSVSTNEPQDSTSQTLTETAESETVPTETVAETDETVYRYSGNPDYPVLADAYLSALPAGDFNGSTFFITSPDTTLFDENEVHYVSETVAKRNAAVEEKYNITLESSKSDVSTMLEEAKKAALAGMYYTNIMCIPFEDVGTFESEGLLMNLRSLPYLDLTQPYFNSTSVNALSAGYKIYGVAGEATPVSSLPCIIYNKNIAESLGITDMYDIAMAGELTWDKLLSYAELCSSSSEFTGAVLEGGETFDYIFKSVGEYYIASKELSVPLTAFEKYSMDWSATYARSMLNMGTSIDVTKDTAAEAFSTGKALFTVGTVGDLDRYRNTDVLVGILPMPKHKAEYEYSSLAGGDALIMTVPEGTTNSEMTSLVLSALNAASYGYITETNASYLHVSTLPDNRSADILEIISRSAVYDFSTGFEKTIPSLAEMKEIIRTIIETGDFTEYDRITDAVNSDLAAHFPLSN